MSKAQSRKQYLFVFCRCFVVIVFMFVFFFCCVFFFGGGGGDGLENDHILIYLSFT